MAMIDAYKIGVELVLGGDLAQGIQALIPGMERLEGLLKSSNTEAKTLASSLRGIGASSAGIGRAADAMERLHRATRDAHAAANDYRNGGGLGPMPGSGGGGGGRSLPLAIPLGPTAPGGGGRLPPPGGRAPGNGMVPFYAPNFTMPPGAIPLNFGNAFNPPTPPAGGGGNGGGGSGRSGFGNMATNGLATLGGFKILEDIFKANVEFEHAAYLLKQQLFTPEQVERAKTLATTMQQTIPGVTLGSGMSAIKDAMTLLQNPEEAMQVAPAFAKFGLALASLGKGDQEKAIFDVLRSAELRGAFNDGGKFSMPTLLGFLGNSVTLMQQSGGRFGPEQMNQFLSSSGVGGRMLSDPSLFRDQMTMVIAMGAARAGTGLQGFSRQYALGRMGTGSAIMMQDAGMFKLDDLPQEYDKKGNPIDKIRQFKIKGSRDQFQIPSERMIDMRGHNWADEAAHDSIGFLFSTLVPGADRYNATHGGVGEDEDERLERRLRTISQMSSNIPGMKYAGEALYSGLLIKRDEEANDRFLAARNADIKAGRNPLDMAQDDPRTKMLALNASLNAFMIALGGPGMPMAFKALTSLTDGLNSVAKWATANPDGAKLAIESFAAAVALFGASTAAGLAMAALASPVGGIVAVAAGLVALEAAVKGLFGSKTLNGPFQGGAGDLPNGGAFVPMAYHGTTHRGPMVQNVTYVTLDGRVIAKAVTKHQTAMMGGQVSGTLRPDPTITPHYGAHLLEA